MGKLATHVGLACALAASCQFAYTAERADAADIPPPVRPRICLVLSGGGARGMAHIGVLKVLEELKVPIDCIAGTSMGAVVGGLYASGMTAAQIDTTIRSVDWQEAFRDAPPRRDLAFRRKQDDRNFLVRLPLGLKHGTILLPKGFIQGQKLQETLRQLTLPFSNSTDFDLLPTPFRAVATDLETGKAVVMDKGDLAIAMRASMSAPGVFAPVESNGRLLVDGGLAENLPISVARAMHADILIVSDVSFPLLPRAALDSALSISNQMLAILVRKDSDRQRSSLSPQDILIEPTLGSATPTDFTSPSAVIALPEGAMRSAGLSGSKAAAISDLARKIEDGTVPLDDVESLSDDELVARLVQVRGIGRWTAEMFLIFQLGRLDVWPVDDYGVRKGWARAHKLADLPAPRALQAEGERFRPYRTIAAWYCWRAVDTVLQA